MIDPNQIPLDQPIDFKQIKLLTNTLLDLPYEDLVKKYDREDFFLRVFNFNIQPDITLLRDMMIIDFLEKGNETIAKFPAEKRELAIRVLAQNGEAADLESKLKEIDPNLILPKNFDAKDYHERAAKIYNALQSIKMAIAEEGYVNFLDDTTRFLHYSPEKIKQFSQEIETISEELAKEYENLTNNNTPPNLAVINKAADLTGRLGRIPVFVETLKEKKNLGEVSEVIQKLSASLKIAAALKTKNLPNLDRETIIAEIKKYLVENTFL